MIHPHYQVTIKWSCFWKDRTELSVGDSAKEGESIEELRKRVKRQAIAWAKQSGWTPPRWWQFWRWFDTRISEKDLQS